MRVERLQIETTTEYGAVNGLHAKVIVDGVEHGHLVTFHDIHPSLAEIATALHRLADIISCDQDKPAQQE
jgi:hypothetical protein